MAICNLETKKAGYTRDFFMKKSVEEMTRSERLKKRMLDAPPIVESERMRLVTEAYKMTEGEEIQIRRAKAFKYIVENMTLRLTPDELIVGNNGIHIKGGVLFPENNVEWIVRDLDTFEVRPNDPFLCPEETKKEIRELAEYWYPHSKWKLFKSMIPEETLSFWDTEIYNAGLAINYGIGHANASYGKILEMGWKGLRKQVEEALEKIDIAKNPQQQESFNFYRAMLITTDAAMIYCKRYARFVADAAEKEADPIRKKELQEIAQICENVSEEPAHTFKEACQLFFFTHVLQWIEQDGYSWTPGRFDKYMYPYYKADIEAGRITREEALERIECLFVKFCEIVQFVDAYSAKYWAGDPTGQDMNLGGQDENGRDMTNDITYLCLDAMEHMQTIQPNLSVRYHDNTPDKLRRRAAEVIKTGCGMPQNFNDKVIIDALLNRGVSLQEARNYCIIGCVELLVGEDGFCNGGAAWVTATKMLELALNGGVSRYGKTAGKLIGVKTKDPRTFTSFEEVYDAFLQQMRYCVKQGTIIINTADWVHGELSPQPFFSSLLKSPIKKGRDVTRGGAGYNSIGPQAVGVVNIGNSLAALKKFVFEEKRFTMAEMIDMLDSNFAGKETERQLLLNRAPKYGNDDDYVDELVARVSRDWCNEVSQYTIPRRGGTHAPGIYTVISNVPFGAVVGALPSGRLAGAPLADGGLSPQVGTDKKGPSAVINSASKIDQRLAANGTILNQKFTPSALDGDEGTQNLASLIKTYHDKGGYHIQFNVVSAETLRDAQQHPENYQDMLVRVAGYSAYFTSLSSEIQDNIIRRAEQGA